jgi:integrase
MAKSRKQSRIGRCDICGQERKLRDKNRAICRRCAMRQAFCDRCGRSYTTEVQHHNLCRHCVKKAEKVQCSRCARSSHSVSDQTGLCPGCTALARQLKATCTRCQKEKVIYNPELVLCYYCDMMRRRRSLNMCSICGKFCISTMVTQAICVSCWKKKLNGESACSRCGKTRIIRNKGLHLCAFCDADRLAPDQLRRYVEQFQAPYPHNVKLLELLVTAFEWRLIDRHVLRRVKAFGAFLQAVAVPWPLNWECIEHLLPPIDKSNLTKTRAVRACLFELGHLLAARGDIETRTTYVERQRAIRPIERAPAAIQPLLHDFTAWMFERSYGLASVRTNLSNLTAFWQWCEREGMRMPAEVSIPAINAYYKTVRYQWRCSACHGVTAHNEDGDSLSCCPHCQTHRSLVREERLAHRTLMRTVDTLKLFFAWAKQERKTVINPVRITMERPTRTIEHYDSEVIRALMNYVSSPESDPEEALILYLILVHACSVGELCLAQLPKGVALDKDRPASLAEMYHVILPQRQATIGKRASRRSRMRLDFPAAIASWLMPLLQRYQTHRSDVLVHPRNRYLFVGPHLRRNLPVGPHYIRAVVRRATERVLGAACNPATLRKTAGILLTDSAGAGMLEWMGWEAQQAFIYTWAARKVVHPKPRNKADVPNPLAQGEPRFPPMAGETE